MIRGMGPESVPRYAPPTPAELDAIYGAVESLCDGCVHAVFVTDYEHSRPHLPRNLVVCVREHDEDYCADAEIVDRPMVECPSYSETWE